MDYGGFKDLNRRIATNKVLRDKAINNTKNVNYDRYQRELASMFCKFFNKKTSGSAIKNENFSNKQLAVELHKPVIRKFMKRKVASLKQRISCRTTQTSY